MVWRLADAGFEKITFAGGEPLLCPWIIDLVSQAAAAGLTTSLVTNGSLLSDDLLLALTASLDVITVSIDSLQPATLLRLGRKTAGATIHEDQYRLLCKKIKAAGFALKINTVVTSANWLEDVTDFIVDVQPERWKILQVLPMRGQNSTRVDQLLVADDQFAAYISRHQRVAAHGIRLIPENNDAMIGSYALVDPAGRFFGGKSELGYTYSDPILSVGVDHAIAQMEISREKFLARGGLYELLRERVT